MSAPTFAWHLCTHRDICTYIHTYLRCSYLFYTSQLHDALKHVALVVAFTAFYCFDIIVSAKCFICYCCRDWRASSLNGLPLSLTATATAIATSVTALASPLHTYGRTKNGAELEFAFKSRWYAVQ